MPHIVRSTTLMNEFGLHARPISKLITVMRGFQSSVVVRCGSSSANGSRMLDMLQLRAAHGSEIEFTVDGDDAEAAVAALLALVDGRFGEGPGA